MWKPEASSVQTLRINICVEGIFESIDVIHFAYFNIGRIMCKVEAGLFFFFKFLKVDLEMLSLTL